MDNDEIRNVTDGIAARGGLTALLHLLGFTAPLRKRACRQMPRVDVRVVRTGERDTLRVHVFELRCAFQKSMLRELSRLLRGDEPFAHHVLVVTEPHRRRVVIACDALHSGIRHIQLEPHAIRRSDVETLRDLAAVDGESGTAAALRIYHALDRRRLTTRFFRDVRGVRDTVARAWSGLPASAAADRDALALLLLSRLMFLYFLQRRGLLAGDAAFLPRLLARWRRRIGTPTESGTRRTFYRTVVRTLFFGVLNRRRERRTPRAIALGDLPYLNGGLFEEHRIERHWRSLDLADDVLGTVFDSLLEKYRFTTADSAGSADDSIGAGIDPEMLGRIFEGLMPGDRRSRTGTFYTPVAAVDALVVKTLATHFARTAGVAHATAQAVLRGEQSDASDRDLRALARAAASVRVLDPACGSGAFLLGAISCMERARSIANDGDAVACRREIVGESLHGVDLLDDAALICSLRLWLSLIPRCDDIADVPPLPNLDRRIRQGDALVDPLDIGASFAGRPLTTAAPPQLRQLMLQLEPAAREYMISGPESRAALRRSLAALEARLARAWLDAQQQQIELDLRELRARASDLDLFGAPTAQADSARSRLPGLDARLREMRAFRDDLRGPRALPFFSFRVHFAGVDAFDVVLSNPPWVRAHNWPPAVRKLLRQRYRVCFDAGWPHATTLTTTPHGAGAQVDLAFLFLERSLCLLREGGTLGMVLPAKLIRSLAPGGARALLLAQTRITSIEDHSLDHRAVFEADAFTVVLVAERTGTSAAAAAPAPPTSVRMTRGAGRELGFEVAAADLPLLPGDPHSPWLLAPPSCAAAFRAMQRAGGALGASGLAVRRGAMTGANDIMVVQDVEPKLGDLARIRTEGYYGRTPGERRSFAGYVEASALRPVIRGADVQPWHIRIERHVLWSPRNDDARASHPRRLGAYFARHAVALNQSAGRLGLLQRLSSGMYGPKVVWSDLASDLRAAAVPASIRTITGTDAPVVPMNTVYFIATPCDRIAHLLAGYLNSMPLRTFARAIAERAKDAHFRFFAWTISLLPLPRCWQEGPAADRVIAISREAHRAGAIEPRLRAELDALVARAYGLDAGHVESIAMFDEWLDGRERET